MPAPGSGSESRPRQPTVLIVLNPARVIKMITYSLKVRFRTGSVPEPVPEPGSGSESRPRQPLVFFILKPIKVIKKIKYGTSVAPVYIFWIPYICPNNKKFMRNRFPVGGNTCERLSIKMNIYGTSMVTLYFVCVRLIILRTRSVFESGSDGSGFESGLPPRCQ